MAINGVMADESEILIVGAGASGLAAARELSSKFNVTVLEARARIGGRIHTHLDPAAGAPIEFGAEFVHGKPPETLEIIRDKGFELIELPNTHWYFRNALLSQSKKFWSKIEAATSAMEKHHGADESFADFLQDYSRKHEIEDINVIASLYIEGFHAAHADRISVQGLNKTNEAAAAIDDEKQFRPATGYLPIAQRLHDEAVAHGASFRFETVVSEIDWSAGAIAITSTLGEQFKARRLVLTLPLGVLQRNDVIFTPELTAKQEAAQKLAVGNAVKVILRFRDPFWEQLTLPTVDGKRSDLKNLAFIHAPDELPPTWWTQLPVRAPLLVGWAGGPRADLLTSASQDALRDQSLEALSRIFAMSPKALEELLVDFYTHNWATDPFSLGAYSYIPVGGLEAQAALAEPIENTIYFAGEAANTKGHHGTVHGALATGLRAAEMIQQNS